MEEHNLKPENVAFGKRLRKLLYDLEVSQADFAKKTGISTSVISKIMNGGGGFSANVPQAIVKAYPEVDIAWLIGNGNESNVEEDYIKISKDEVIKKLEEENQKLWKLLMGNKNDISTQMGAFSA
jgi:transcriptional regulator with XRE-family HTH domain